MANKFQASILGVVGVGVGLSLSYYFYKKCTEYKEKIEQTPVKWKQIGTLEEIHFFPLKSCAPIDLDQALCENLGIRIGSIKDRALMIIEDNGELITARGYPNMLLIVSRIIDRTQLVLSAPGMSDLKIDHSKFNENANFVKSCLFGQTVLAKDCGEECNRWLSMYILGKSEGLKLVYYHYENPTRPIHDVFQNGIFSKKDTGTFQDVSSYHLINLASVEELNSRLTNKIFPRQFRSNFYVKTELPYDEDNWEWIRIGDEAMFRNIAPCFRCILPNINPFTAERDPDGQPLKTLKTYRMDSNSTMNSPMMGIQMGLRSEGTVKKGDPVFINVKS